MGLFQVLGMFEEGQKEAKICTPTKQVTTPLQMITPPPSELDLAPVHPFLMLYQAL